MTSTATFRFFACILLLCCTHRFAAAQSIADTTRLIQILKGNSLREKIIDTTAFQTIAGDVLLKEGLTLFSCDSAAVNKATNIMEAYGNIHINQQDSIHTYAQYLKYIGKERMAYLKNKVRLSDKKGTLHTDELEFDLKTNIGHYKKGGKVINGKTVLTSEEGTYYGDTKDVYFRKKVHLVDPKYNITTDSLLYNTLTQVATFISLTHIRSKDGMDIYTSSGTYDLKNGKAFFGQNPVFKDSSGRVYTARNIAIDEASNTAQLEGDAVIRDSVNGYTIIGGQIFAKNDDGSFLASRKPVLIFKGEGNDSTFVAADTLFSGIIRRDSTGKKIVMPTDTLRQTTVIAGDSVSTPVKKNMDGHTIADSLQKQLPDSLHINIPDSTVEENKLPSLKDSTIDTSKAITQLDTLNSSKKINRTDFAFSSSLDTSNAVAKETSAPKTSTVDNSPYPNSDSTATKDTTAIRYFQAFHHVRIFNDSMQAVCDSLFYSSEDSVFRLFTQPIVFSNKSQIAGDTIYLYTLHKKAHRVFVFDRGIIMNELNIQMYNQVSGRTINGYFKNGELDYVRAKGSPAESVFYPQDEDSAFTGMNRCKGDVIEMNFVNKEVNKVKFINDVEGALYPMNQVPQDQKQLPLFNWQEARRPKNKLELFE